MFMFQWPTDLGKIMSVISGIADTTAMFFFLSYEDLHQVVQSETL